MSDLTFYLAVAGVVAFFFWGYPKQRTGGRRVNPDPTGKRPPPPPAPPRCSCDDFSDSPCKLHERENRLHDELLSIRVDNEELIRSLRTKLAIPNDVTDEQVLRVSRNTLAGLGVELSLKSEKLRQAINDSFPVPKAESAEPEIVALSLALATAYARGYRTCLKLKELEPDALSAEVWARVNYEMFRKDAMALLPLRAGADLKTFQPDAGNTKD